MPVFIDNDANVATLVEQRFGAARGANHVVGLTIGTGIGGGLVLDGKLYRGPRGRGAELGHMVIDENGPRCQGNCPNHGCLEAVASGTAIGREGTDRGRGGLGLRPRAGRGGRPGDHRASSSRSWRSAATRCRAWCSGTSAASSGIGFANFVNIFNPEVIVVGGGAMAAGDLLLEPAREEMRRARPAAQPRAGARRAGPVRPRGRDAGRRRCWRSTSWL